jgi:thiamine-phosphate pyrophosphorylase
MTDRAEPTRLLLVTPRIVDAHFPARLSEALMGGDVAAVLIATGDHEAAVEAIAANLVPLVQEAGAAALIADHTRVAGRLKADGVQVGTGLGDLRAAAESFRPKRIVGAGNIHSRHAAMEAGETGADYLFFGRLHGDTHDEAHPKALDLAEWWSALMEIPAVIMAGRSLDSIADAAATGAAFVALNDAVWLNAQGAGEAVRLAHAVLSDLGRRAA